MRRHQTRDPFKVGLAVLIVGALISYFGLTRTNPFHNGYEVKATFASVLSNGVHPGSPVRVAGVNVGKVKAVERGAGQTVDVTMEITDAGRPIHRDATIKARPRIFLEGNYFLEIKPGTSTAPELDSGGKIPLSQTAIPVQFDELVSTFSAPTRQSNRDVIEGFAESLRHGGAEALRAGYEVSPGAFRGLAVNMKALRGTQPGDLARFVSRQAKLSGTLDENRVALADLITRLRVTTDTLASRQEQLAASLPELERLLDAAPPALRALDGLLPPLRRLSVALRPSLKIAPDVLDHALPFVGALDSLLQPDRLDALVKTLRPTVSTLRKLEGSLPEPLRLTEKISDCSVDNVLPVLNMEVPDGHLSTDQPVWQDLLHGLANLTAAQGNYGGDGYATRYSFGLSQNVVTTSVNAQSDLVMLAGEPLVGSRPKWTPGHQPPYEPDVPCETQPIVKSVESETVPALPVSRTIKLKPTDAWSRKQLTDRLRKSLKVLKKARVAMSLMRQIRTNLPAMISIVGLLVLAIGVSFYILRHQRLRLPYDPIYTLQIELPTGQALTPGQGQSATVAGVRVGEVAKVQLRDGRALVDLAINDEELPEGDVRTDAHVIVRPRTPLNDMTIEIEPGSPKAPRLAGRRGPRRRQLLADGQPRRDPLRAGLRHALVARDAAGRDRARRQGPRPGVAADLQGRDADARADARGHQLDQRPPA